MAKDMRRALRRHHRERMKRKVEFVLKNIRYSGSIFNSPDWFVHEPPSEFIEEQAKKLADNFQVCSCPMCGNYRRHFGVKTLAEYRQEEDLEETLQEWLDNKK